MKSTSRKTLSDHAVGTRKKIYVSSKRRGKAVLDGIRDAQSRPTRFTGSAAPATDDPHVLALQASQRVVRNHLDTISIVLTRSGEVASLFDVAPAVLNHWSSARLPDPGQRDRIRQFADLVSLLLQRFPPPVAAGWLREFRVHEMDGGSTPLVLLREEKWDVVRAYAEEAVSEAFG